ncbi:MAG: endolytic transglycosylase MltG [Eubacterium sp.]|nr:endolytic transglycosylase MltG [Eubacterium sp.]
MDNEELKIEEVGINPVSTAGESSDLYFSNVSGQEDEKEKPQRDTSVSDTKKKPMKKKDNSVKGTYMFFIVVIALSMLCSVYAVFCMNDVLAITKTSSNVTVNIDDSVNTTSKAVDVLADNGLIKCKNFCKLFAKFRETYVGAPYEPGIYYLNGKMGLEGMLQAMHGNATTAETVRLVFPEGLTTPEIVDKLADNDVCGKAALLSAIESVDYSYSLVSNLEASEEVPYRLEGYLFPDTYDFYVGESASSVIKKLLDNGDTKITKSYRERADELGLSMHDVIIIASIIQMEAGNEEQMKEISAIIHNRLNDSVNFPSLGCESTKDYINNKVAPSLSSTSAHTADYYLEYYSTDASSTVVGLPAGPICNPGMAAIDAALYPADSNAYYFFHDNNGNMYTADTYAEFKEKVSVYAPYLNY